MFAITIKSLRANALRLVLSSLAIVLGVAFIAGTMVFTDGVKAASYEKVGKLDKNTSVAVEWVESGTPSPQPNEKPGFDRSVIDRIAKLPGIAAVEGVVRGGSGLMGSDGKPVKGYSQLSSIPAGKDMQSYAVTAGHLPARDGELVLDSRTFDKQKFVVGQKIKTGGETGEPRDFTLAGVVDVTGTQLDFGGPFLGFTASDALALGGTTKYTGIVVRAAPGTSDAAAAEQVKSVVGRTGDVKTRQQVLDDGLARVVGSAKQFNKVLLTFGAISVLVAAFVIANTFTIVLAQRTRQTALLRLVGATRGQAFRSVVLESVVVGLVASLAGIGAGIGIATGLQAGMRAMDFPMEGGLVLTWTTVAISLAIGVGITVLSALMPAWRGTNVAPVAALSDAAVETARKVGKVRLTFGALILALGAAGLFEAAQSGTVFLVGAGGALTFLGIVMFGPVLVPALVRVLGWPLRKIFGATATLAISNAVRNPRRISATAVAMVIGIGLVTAFQVAGESVKAGIANEIDQSVGTDFSISSQSGEVPRKVIDALRALPELGSVMEPRRSYENGVQTESAHPDFVKSRGDIVAAGDPHALKPGKAVTTVPYGAPVGGTVQVGGKSFEVVAVLKLKPEKKDGPENPDKRVYITDADFTATFPTIGSYDVFAQTASGSTAAQAKDALDKALDGYPTLMLMDKSEYKKMMTGTVDMILSFVTALLGMAVIISLIGVANTLTLSVVERTRENGVLRAVGLTRGKLRGMLAVEAILMALVGTLLGVGLGLAVSATSVLALNSVGAEFAVTVPWVKMAIIVGVAAAAALAASILPARRAVKRPIVESLGAE